jgi:hypothetical protein
MNQNHLNGPFYSVASKNIGEPICCAQFMLYSNKPRCSVSYFINNKQKEASTPEEPLETPPEQVYKFDQEKHRNERCFFVD